MATVILEELSPPDDAQSVPHPLAPGLDPNWSLADLQAHLGGIPLNRIRLYPSPGRATEQDLLAINDRKTGLVELIDGVLVEKAMGFYESQLGAILIYLLLQFVLPRKLGAVFGESCPIRLFPTQVREPDVCFIAWTRFPDGKLPAGQILGYAPDLAVEVLSPSNTRAEMERKLNDYFQAGVKLVWHVDPETESVRVFRSPTDFVDLTNEMILDGGDVLPGFEISVKSLFDLANRR